MAKQKNCILKTMLDAQQTNWQEGGSTTSSELMCKVERL